jgi:hypothetical protein
MILSFPLSPTDGPPPRNDTPFTIVSYYLFTFLGLDSTYEQKRGIYFFSLTYLTELGDL